MIFDPDSWQEIWGTIRRNRLRTALTALGVFWGVFMLVVLVGAGRGLENGAKRTMAGFAANSLFLWSDRTSKPFQGLQPGRSISFRTEDIEPLRQVAGVDVVAPRTQLGGWRSGNNVTRGEKTGAFFVMGDFPEIHQVQMLQLTRGRLLNELDLREHRKVALIGDRVRELLFRPDENPVGQLIDIKGVQFQVIGVFRSPQPAEQGERHASSIHVPFTTFQRAFNTGNRVGWFALTIGPGYRSEDVEKRVTALLAKRHRVAPDDPQAIGGFDAEKEFQKLNALFTGIRILIWIVGTLTLLAGVVGVSNIMLISVKERTKEIGVRKALGATPARVVGQILQESVALTSLSGYVGLVSGVALLEVVRTVLVAAEKRGQAPAMFANPGVSLAVALTATVVLIVAGALAGVIPARSAARVDPAVALRAE